ncbi:MAG: bifunctional hydroxymethylpyrimidine kinase/phosphomethylpyrimidine kinase [Desulfotomaculaceae bacterium]|nr:bifunctional hydroxymethylpyrimidine kinase/phosphomethylpyrimidine kinase [Desulfotomaculaceae bacterium]
MKTVLTIAGSDSCGGAGIQADLKTFSALGAYGMSVITAVTAQNTMGVFNVRELDVDIIKDQINCLFEDIKIDAVKVGMVSSIEIIDVIGECLKKNRAANIVVDPVMVSKSGYYLLREEAKDELVKVLFPLAEVVTPNLFEAELITGDKIENLAQMEEAAVKINGLGSMKVIVKGGHLTGDAIDVVYNGKNFNYLKGARIETKNTHGTGCTFSSAIAALLAGGYPISEAARLAKEYINGAIEHSFELGRGVGPTNHFYNLYHKAGWLND